jgi:hypothetical protein
MLLPLDGVCQMRGRRPPIYRRGEGKCATEYSSLECPKPTTQLSFSTFIAPTQRWTDQRVSARAFWRKMGQRGASIGAPAPKFVPNGPIFGEHVDLSISFPWIGGWPKTESRCILGVHFTRACSCSPRWIWTGFWASTSWVYCWEFWSMFEA